MGTIAAPDDVFYLVTDELNRAIEARKASKALPEYAQLAAERRELREARKRLHPPGTIPSDANGIQVSSSRKHRTYNDPNSPTLVGVPVSPGTVTSPASLINSPDEFDKMEPGSILVCPMTNPAWTPLFAYATGLGDRHGRHPRAWIHRRPGVRHPGRGRNGQHHPAGRTRAGDPGRWRRRHRDDSVRELSLEAPLESPESTMGVRQHRVGRVRRRLGVSLFEQSGLDLSRYEWGFSEEYTHIPERLLAGRDTAGYHLMIHNGKVSGGTSLPDECLALPGFHASIDWALIAHSSYFPFNVEGQRQRAADHAA